MKHGALAARAWPGIAVVAIGLAALLVVVTVDAPPSGSDAAQIQAGWAAYAAHCAVCHGVTLAGGTGPALDRSGLHHRYPRALDLYRYIRERMPLEGVGPGGLSDADYLAITAAILDKRGVPQDGALNSGDRCRYLARAHYVGAGGRAGADAAGWINAASNRRRCDIGPYARGQRQHAATGSYAA